jgi:hypothetical protein
MTRRLAWKSVGIIDGHEDYERKGWREGYDNEWFRPTPWQKVKPDDRLWVRETWAHYHTVNHIRRPHGGALDEVSDGLAGYRADGHETIEEFCDHIRLMSGHDLEGVAINGDRWRPSIHMPRWASRLTLIVIATKIERIQDISEEDAIAEGVERNINGRYGVRGPFGGWLGDNFDTAKEAFQYLWMSLHGAEGWHRNPEVVALSFKVHKRNIDTMPMAVAA